MLYNLYNIHSTLKNNLVYILFNNNSILTYFYILLIIILCFLYIFITEDIFKLLKYTTIQSRKTFFKVHEIKCPICFEYNKTNFSVVKLKCNHCFHKKCILKWLLTHRTCPICRNYCY